MKDIFSVQDEITRQIVADLNVEVKEAEFDRVRRLPTENLSAYDAFLRGLDRVRRTAPTTLTMHPVDPEARRMFERAIELDPKFAAAYAALGIIIFNELIVGADAPVSPQLGIEKWLSIDELAEKALSADDSDASAHILSALASLMPSRNPDRRKRKGPDRALVEVKRAIALDPNDALIRINAALFFDLLENPNQAILEAEQAMRLNPHYPPWYLTVLGMAYTSVGRYQEAIDAHRKAVLGNPDLVLSHAELAEIYGVLGRKIEEEIEERETRRLYPEYPGPGLLMPGIPAKVPAAPDPSAQPSGSP